MARQALRLAAIQPPENSDLELAGAILPGAVAATIIQTSLLWDMSWHFSIGRDNFWTPAHLAIYLGTLLGVATAAITIARSSQIAWKHPASSRWVSVLGFHGPAGAWVTLVGSAAMLASGFFDDWWHRVYGLDVAVLSPPHVILILGMAVVQLGFWMMARVVISESPSSKGLRLAGNWLAGTFVLALAVLITEQTFRTYMHGARFWLTVSLVFPFALVGFRISGDRWGATQAALGYTVVRLLVLWILPLFPAEPRLGPVFSPVTHMVPPDFPLLLIVPAFALDLMLQRKEHALPTWRLAFSLGGVFLLMLLVVQWPFAIFLLSRASRVAFFATDNFRYSLPSLTHTVRGEFFTEGEPPLFAFVAITASFLVAMLSARAGLALNHWAGRLRR